VVRSVGEGVQIVDAAWATAPATGRRGPAERSPQRGPA
jgi:hypothetical protein